MLCRTFLAFLVTLTGALVLAADPVPPATGSKAEEFKKVNSEWTDLIANLGALKNEYSTSADAARKAEIHKQYDAGVEKAKGLEGKLVAAAESAYKEAPNTDPKITEFLVVILYDQVNRDDYEPAFQLGKMLMDNKCPDKLVPALAGVAAYCVNEFDMAGPWLKAAKASGMLSRLSNEMGTSGKGYDFALFPDMIEETKAAWAKEKKIRDAEAKADDLPRVLMKTSEGDIEIELFENEAPNTVLNFITLVDKGFYNGLKFHRVFPHFMAQGGDPKGDGSGGPGYAIPCECYQENHRLHYRGSLCMAHAGRDTGGSQFFLTFVPTSFLDGRHTVFGRVISGFDVLAKIKRRNPEDATVGPADTIIEAKVTRRRPHSYDAKDLKKSG